VLYVILISHLYPRADKPVLGCFVQAQAVALAQGGKVHASVVSGVPYSLACQGPIRLLKSLWRYGKALRHCQWQHSNDTTGVSLLRVPFLIHKQWIPFGARPLSYALALWLVAPKIRALRGKPSVIHAHTAFLDGTAARCLAQYWHCPYVLTEHSYSAPGPYATYKGSRMAQWFTRFGLQKAHCIMAVSPGLAKRLEAFLSPSPKRPPIRVLPNGVDTERFCPAEASPTAHDERWHILFIGSLDDNKDPLTLLTAFAQLCQAADRPWHLTLIGQGLLQATIEAFIRHDQLLDNRVTLLGNQPVEAIISQLQQRCHVLVLPSKAETFGMVLIEAMACGKPVISTLCDGPLSIVNQPFLGRLVPTGQAKALTKAIRAIADHPEDYPAQAIKGHVLQHYSQLGVVQGLFSVYSQSNN
jgi:glycosyltransferase involved in cell wall biosynthesis